VVHWFRETGVLWEEVWDNGILQQLSEKVRALNLGVFIADLLH
jgi:hypothetical protein